MLAAHNRLRRRQDVLSVIKKGNLWRGRYLNIYWVSRPGSPGPRLAFVVGKKVHKTAIKRHKIQRWLREIARSTIQGRQDSIDMVWVAKPMIVSFDSKQQLESALASSLQKIFDK